MIVFLPGSFDCFRSRHFELGVKSLPTLGSIPSLHPYGLELPRFGPRPASSFSFLLSQKIGTSQIISVS